MSSLQFILGSAGYDHAAKVTDQMVSDMYNNDKDDKYFYLVPNHIKFESEVDTLKRLNHKLGPKDQDNYAQMNVQILSLTRMAWFFLSRRPEYQHTRLSSSGINMLIYQIILDHKDELTIFGGEIGRPGFILKLAQQIDEMQSGRIAAEDLVQIMQKNPDWNSDLRQKMHDFIIIYQAFEEATHGKYLHTADTLRLLCNYLGQKDLSNYHFYISGFSQLTAQEKKLVEILMYSAGSVTIDLVLDRKYPTQLPKRPNLFYQSARLYHQLYKYARENHVKVLADRYVDTQFVNDDLLKLDHYWITSNQFGKIYDQRLSDPDSIQVLQSDNNYSEVAKVAIKIRQMVASGKYRYSDFLVVTRHLDKYQNIIRPIFQMQQIPYFDDLQKSMAEHPLVELLNSLFTVYQVNSKRNYKYQDIMRLLKTELLIPKDDDGNFMNIDEFRNDLALTENVVLKNGYEGSRWLQKNDWLYHRINFSGNGINQSNTLTKREKDITDRINLIRHFVKDTLPPFYRRMKRAQNGSEAIKFLYQFLDQNGVIERLKQWRDEATDRGDLSLAAQPEQVWNTFCQLLDDFNTILGEREFHLDDFLNLLQAGFEGASYSLIPSTLDQVAISESGIVQMKDYKVVFMIGSTDDTMPDQMENDALFNDADRDGILSDNESEEVLGDDQFLSENTEEQMANEPYLNYLAFMCGSDRLIFTYSLSREDNNDSGVQISPYVARIKDHFQINNQYDGASPVADSDDIQDFIGTKQTTLRHLIQAGHDSKRNQRKMATNWQYIYAQLIQEPDFKDLTKKLLGGLDYNNTPTSLRPNIVTELYGKDIWTSISQLEQFYNDPYEYFLKYGLNLKEREEFDLSPRGMGDFYHEALREVISLLQRNNRNLADVQRDDLNQYVDQIVENMLQDPEYTILTSSYRMQYLRNQLSNTIKRMIWTMHLQSQYTLMRPHGTEVTFGNKGRNKLASPLSFEVNPSFDPNLKRTVNVRGRIDRIDEMNINNKRYFGIVDYKSRDKHFDFGQVHDGDAMQMLTYLDVLKHNLDRLSSGEQADLAGALYSTVRNPQLSTNDFKDTVDRSMLNKQKYNGILLNDPDLLSGLIENDDARSNVYKGLRRKKDGTFSDYNNGPLIKPDDLNLLLDHTEELIKQAGNRIFSGDISMAPARFKNGTRGSVMDYTPYKSIMQFDPLLKENNYRDVNDYQLKELIDKLKEER